MNFIVIIPVRLFSVRFPGKVLADIHGKPMIIRVMEKALDSGADRVIVATDSVYIARYIESERSTCEVCLTRSDHQSGTERIAEVVNRYKFPDNQIIVHLQGDEPLIESHVIRRMASVLNSINLSDTANMVTLATPLNSLKEAYDSNVVKVVVNKNSNALYFSRSVIPWHHKYLENNLDFGSFGMLLRHVGIYAYRAKFFSNYITWVKSPLEQLEQLEQLRVLWYEETIYVSIIDNISNVSVDTPEALERVNMLFKKN